MHDLKTEANHCTHSDTIFKAHKYIAQSEPLLPRFSHRFDPGIQMRSYLDWTMATMQLTLIRRYSLLSIFQNLYIIMEYPVLIPLILFGQCLASTLKHWHSPVPGTVGVEEEQFASGWPEFSQELLQCVLIAQVRIRFCSSITQHYYAAANCFSSEAVSLIFGASTT